MFNEKNGLPERKLSDEYSQDVTEKLSKNPSKEKLQEFLAKEYGKSIVDLDALREADARKPLTKLEKVKL
jgi:hypothetical protein